MRVGVIFGAIRNPHEPPVAGEGGGARKAQIGAALENEIARANLCDCPYRTERTVSGWRIDPLQAVPSPALLLERREARKRPRLKSSHSCASRMPYAA